MRISGPTLDTEVNRLTIIVRQYSYRFFECQQLSIMMIRCPCRHLRGHAMVKFAGQREAPGGGAGCSIGRGREGRAQSELGEGAARTRFGHFCWLWPLQPQRR